MSNNSIINQIKLHLDLSLKNMGKFKQCALLNYPNYGNIGDHLIGLGTVLYLTDVLKTKIKYVASLKNFSAEVMEAQIGDAPIILQGGGNLGDLWYEHQQFREFIISKYQDRPIIILPQTIYFNNQGCLKKAVKIFNSHPNLTIFARDNHSYKFALKNFSQCRIFLAPDLAFQLVDMPGLDFKISPKNKILYLRRKDKELSKIFDISIKEIANLITEDWVSYKYRWLLEDVVQEWIQRQYQVNLGKTGSFFIHGLTKLYREGWQRGLATPREWFQRYQWEHKHPYNQTFERLYNSQMYRLSLSLIHSGIYQLTQYKWIITSRLHGHILAVLLGIPHIFLPNSYYKNQAFYESWTFNVPFCKFIQDPSQIKEAIQQWGVKAVP